MYNNEFAFCNRSLEFYYPDDYNLDFSKQLKII